MMDDKDHDQNVHKTCQSWPFSCVHAQRFLNISAKIYL